MQYPDSARRTAQTQGAVLEGELLMPFPRGAEVGERVEGVWCWAHRRYAASVGRAARHRRARCHRSATAVDGRSALGPGRAREYTRRVCGRWEVPATQTEAAAVIVSELVTNAVVHTSSDRVLIAMALAAGCLTVSVTDQGPAARLVDPSVTEFDPDAEHGRGLWLVSLLATDMGHGQTVGAGTRVWAHLNLAETA